MPIPVLMPALSPTMKEGNLTKWLKKDGDKVSAGDIIAEIETDKATMEVESVDDGIIGKILVPEGTNNVPVNKTIAVILNEDEDSSKLESFISTLDEKKAEANKKESTADKPKETDKPKIEENKTQIVSNNTNETRIFVSPLARRIAQQNNINLAHIQGSGPKGRIVKADIEKTMATGSAYQTASFEQRVEELPLTSMRKTIAERLTFAKQTIPHFYLSSDVNISKLLDTRQSINEHLENTKITINDFIVKACGLALVDVPALNATFHESHIKRYKNADVCVAVAIEDGLITPILTAANLKPLKQISQEVKNLISKAKNGQLTPNEYQGGSFTISNLGMYGIKNFDAIINPPQASILAVGGIQKQNNQSIITLTLSVDHRAVDGADGAIFLNRIKTYLENPALILL